MAPWSAIWQYNGFAMGSPTVAAWLDSPFVRGAVSGIGIVTGIAGLIELAGAFGLHRPADESELASRD